MSGLFDEPFVLGHGYIHAIYPCFGMCRTYQHFYFGSDTQFVVNVPSVS